MNRPEHVPSSILLIEDDDAARESLKVLLELEGYSVLEAANGQEALKLLLDHESAPRMILLDLMMPVMSGTEFLARRSRNERLRQVPVLVMTGMAESRLSKEMQPFSLQVAGVLPKPVEMQNLLKVIHSMEDQAASVPQPKASLIEDRLKDPIFQELLEASNDGFWIWNVATGEVYFSNRWAEMLGYRREEIKPHVKSWEVLVHPEDLPWVGKVLQAHLDGHSDYYQTEHRVRSKSGEWKWILDRGRVISRDAEGKPLMAAGAHVDITERKRLEAEREQLIKDREILLGVVSHELKNPLNALQNNGEVLSRICALLLSSAGTETQARYQQPVERASRAIRDSAARMSRIISALLDATKLESGTFRISPRSIDLRSVVEAVVSAWQAKAEERRVEIRVEGADQPHLVQGDETRLFQALGNLLDNGLKFSPERGKVRVRLSERSGWVEVEVSDQGPGISAPDLPRVFERFWQSKSVASLGVGLGLFITRGIIQSHGGRIRVESQPGEGARFIIELPKSA